MSRLHAGFPSHYIYEDGEGWHKTSPKVTNEINKAIAEHRPASTAGRTLYPQWPAPKYSERITAWRINPEGYQVARWYWKIDDHEKSHGNNCRILDGGKCARKTIAKLKYNAEVKSWTLAEMPGKASKSEARRADGFAQ